MTTVLSHARGYTRHRNRRLRKHGEPQPSPVLLDCAQRFTVISSACGTLWQAVTYIYELMLLRCPYVRARDYLHDGCLLPLSEKNVLVRYERGKDPLRFHEPWNVFWEPENGKPHPGFAGQLTLRAHETFCSSMLELHGNCAPPLASGGSLDIALATKLTSATARALLARIGKRIEHRYTKEETQREQAAG